MLNKVPNSIPYRVTFGDVRVGDLGRKLLNEAVDRNWVSEGVNVKKFEESFSERFGYPYAIATSSGTDAGITAFLTLLCRGLKRGDEVLTPALGFAASANCILAAGLTPKFVDVELETLNVDPSLIEKRISPRTKAIQVIHTMGKPCKMKQIMELARKYNLFVIEDCCEAHGASYEKRVVGSFGIMGTFSFYAAHIICSAEGGMIVTKDQETAELCRSAKNHGRRNDGFVFTFDRTGFNSKMNDLEAAIGLDGLSGFDETFRVRRDYLNRLLELLKPFEDRIVLYREGVDEVVSPHAFPLVLRDEQESVEKLYAYLESQGIQCKSLFGSLPTQHQAFSFLGYRYGDFPVSERVGRTGLHFGIHQNLVKEDLEYITECLTRYFKQ